MCPFASAIEGEEETEDDFTSEDLLTIAEEH